MSFLPDNPEIPEAPAQQDFRAMFLVCWNGGEARLYYGQPLGLVHSEDDSDGGCCLQFMDMLTKAVHTVPLTHVDGFSGTPLVIEGERR